MPRANQQQTITQQVKDYLAIAEARTAEEYPLQVRAVAKAVRVSPTTVYKYQLEVLITEARERQVRQVRLTGRAIERQAYADLVRDIRAELEQERERHQKMLTQIVLMEANAARLGIDPDELYRDLPKPLRQAPHTGSNQRQSKRQWT